MSMICTDINEGLVQASEVPTSPVAAPRVPILAVIGVGLIGGSFCAALRQAKFAARIVGIGRNPAALQEAVNLGLIDEVKSIGEAGAEADLIMLATPVGAMGKVLAELRPHLKASAVVTDAGSSKSDVVAVARAELGESVARFVPGHPIAGSEQSGPQAASAELYRGRDVILTPLPENSSGAVELVRDAWLACGARVHTMAADEHDAVLASVSHLPHLLAFAFMTQLGRTQNVQQRLGLAGSGFRDFTRIAASSPEMWRDILRANRAAILRELSDYQEVLNECAQLLAEDDSQRLEEMLRQAAQLRRDWNLS